MSESIFEPGREIRHIQSAENDTGDKQGLMSLMFTRDILDQLLFLNTYAIEEMHLDGDTLTCKVRRTTPAKDRSKSRFIIWDYQLQRPNHGVIQYHLCDLSAETPDQSASTEDQQG